MAIVTPGWLDREQWPWTPRRLAVGDGALHLVDEGAGAPMVFVHGTPTWSFEWRHAIRALAPSRRVLALDHLGFGLSDRPATARYTPEAHAARFREAMDVLAVGDDITLVVHDFGGPIALDWALDHADRLRHVVIVNSWMWAFDDDPQIRRRARMVNSALGRWLYRHVNASQRIIMPSAFADRRRLTPMIRRHYLELFQDADSRERVLFALASALLGSSAFYRSLWARRDRLSHVPMTVVWGLRDTAFPRRFLDRWLAAYPRARAVLIEEAGHWPHEEAPDAVIAALREIP